MIKVISKRQNRNRVSVDKRMVSRAVKLGLIFSSTGGENKINTILDMAPWITHPKATKIYGRYLFLVSKGVLKDIAKIKCDLCADKKVIEEDAVCSICKGEGCKICEGCLVGRLVECPDCNISKVKVITKLAPKRELETSIIGTLPSTVLEGDCSFCGGTGIFVSYDVCYCDGKGCDRCGGFMEIKQERSCPECKRRRFDKRSR